MRKSCYDCVRKHLGSAWVFMKEVLMGYPDYEIYVIGELEHAADECLADNPDLSSVIREHRLAWTDDHRHMIPMEDFNSYINACILSDGDNIPAIPDELTGNLAKEDGKVIVHGDTR